MRFCCLFLLLTLVGCAASPPSSSRYHIDQDHGPSQAIDLSHIPDAVPRLEPRSRSGNAPEYEVRGKRYRVLESADGFRQQGTASWYGGKFHGHKTANGEVYDMYAMTAAHKSLPLPTYVRVTNRTNGLSVVVRVNDRGPFHPGRVIDLSYAAAFRLGMLDQGTADVSLEAIIPTVNSEQGRRSFANIPTTLLQLGAFASHEAAERLHAQVSEQFARYPVHLSKRQKAPVLYRVRMGPFPAEVDLERLRHELHQAGFAAVPVVDLP